MNRILTQTDIDNLTDITDWLVLAGEDPLVPGDIYLHTLTDAVGINYNDDTTWAGARNGANIIVNAVELAGIGYLRFRAGNTGNPCFPTDINNISRFKPVLGQLKIIVPVGVTAGNRCLEIEDIEYFEFQPENHFYPGMRDGNIREDDFSIVLEDLNRSADRAMCVISGSINKWVGYRGGIWIYDGFSGFRAMRQYASQLVETLIIERVVRFCSVEGETTYLGQTGNQNNDPLFRDGQLRDIVSLFCAADGLQWNGIEGTVTMSVIENCVVVGSGTSWRDSFLPNQDTADQTQVAGGNFRASKIIFQVWGTTGIQVFHSYSTAARVNRINKDVASFRDCFLGKGRQLGTRVHGSFELGDGGPPVEFRNIEYGEMADTIDQIGLPVYDYYHESASNNTEQYIIDCTYHNSKNNFLANTGPSAEFNNTHLINVTPVPNIPEPEYENNPFEGIDLSKVDIWTSKGRQNTNARTSYFLGDWVWNIIPEGEYAFYECLVAHDSDEIGITTRPDQNNILWAKRTWSKSNGRRSNLAGWIPGDIQLDRPNQLNLKLVQDSYQSRRGVGLSFNAPRTDRTQNYLEWTENNGSNSADLTQIREVVVKNHRIPLKRYNYLKQNRWVRSKIITTNNETLRSNWIQIP